MSIQHLKDFSIASGHLPQISDTKDTREPTAASEDMMTAQ
jgi:hypothetical protein